MVVHPLPKSVRRRSAFTLIELVLVLTILAVLMGAAIFSLNRGGFFEGAAERSRVSMATRWHRVVRGTLSCSYEASAFSMTARASSWIRLRWSTPLKLSA